MKIIELIVGIFVREPNAYTLLKIQVLYWHQLFHKEPLPSKEPFHSTKVILWKIFFGLLKMFFTLRKNVS